MNRGGAQRRRDRWQEQTAGPFAARRQCGRQSQDGPCAPRRDRFGRHDAGPAPTNQGAGPRLAWQEMAATNRAVPARPGQAIMERLSLLDRTAADPATRACSPTGGRSPRWLRHVIHRHRTDAKSVRLAAAPGSIHLTNSQAVLVLMLAWHGAELYFGERWIRRGRKQGGAGGITIGCQKERHH